MTARCECGKARYTSKRAAQAALKRLCGRFAPVRSYYEPKCGCWHLTSRGRR
jgi:hypothetical protein